MTIIFWLFLFAAAEFVETNEQNEDHPTGKPCFNSSYPVNEES